MDNEPAILTPSGSCAEPIVLAQRHSTIHRSRYHKIVHTLVMTKSCGAVLPEVSPGSV
jgi:hypothetical protein